MNKFYLILVSIFFVTSFSTAEIVNQIEITGNKRVSDETIKVYADIKQVGSDFTRTDLDNILKNLYSTNFFEDVNIEINNNKLTINLNEYPLINEIVLIGEPSKKISEQIRKIISLKIFISKNGKRYCSRIN